MRVLLEDDYRTAIKDHNTIAAIQKPQHNPPIIRIYLSLPNTMQLEVIDAKYNNFIKRDEDYEELLNYL